LVCYNSCRPRSTEDRNAHCRLFLALSDNIKQMVLLHIDSPALKLFSVLKSQFEASGISAEFYAKQSNLAHVFNKEIKGTVGRIEECNIAMHVLHSLPACMRSIQMLILETTPESDKGDWDLSCFYTQCLDHPGPASPDEEERHQRPPMASKADMHASVTPGSPGGGQGPLGPADIRSATRLPPQSPGPPGIPQRLYGGDEDDIQAKGRKFP